MGRFSSEPWFEPEPNRTERFFRVQVWMLTRTGPSVQFRVREFPEPFRTRSEPVRTANRWFSGMQQRVGKGCKFGVFINYAITKMRRLV
jgi:hypothetical protein